MQKMSRNKRILLSCVLGLLGAILIAYVVFCIFALVLGLITGNFKYLGIGFGGLTLPLGGYVVIGDIKALFF